MISAPYCLHCDRRIDPDEAVFVVVEGAARAPARHRESSWVCTRPECLGWIAAAAAEEGCSLLQPQGIFDPRPQAAGLPSWLVWMSEAKAREEAEASGLFSAIYRPFSPTAR